MSGRVEMLPSGVAEAVRNVAKMPIRDGLYNKAAERLA